MDRISSNPFLTAALFRQSADLRLKLGVATQEMSSAAYADPGAALRGDFSALAASDHALARLSGYSAITNEMALVGETMQKALEIVASAAANLTSNLLKTSTALSSAQLATVTSSGRRDFETALSALNTRISERAVFGGVNSDMQPLPDSETILLALEIAIAGETDAQAISDQIDSWFLDPAGYAALYTGGPLKAPVPIAAGEMAAFGVTALDPAIRDTLIGFAKVALLDRGLLGADHSGRAAIARGAGEDLLSSAEARAVLAGRIGTIEHQLSLAQTRNNAEKSALAIFRNGMTAADPYETAVRIQDLESRLDAFYTITARLSRLNLTEYLR